MTTKDELIARAEAAGMEVDRRWSKDTLIEAMDLAGIPTADEPKKPAMVPLLLHKDAWNADGLVAIAPHVSLRPASGRRIVRTDYDADQIIAGNRAAQAEFAGRKWSEGVGDPVASVPMNVYFDQVFPLVQQQDHKAVSRWLNDSDHAAWRMRGGRV